MSVAADGWGILSESAVGGEQWLLGGRTRAGTVSRSGFQYGAGAFTTTSVSAGVVVC